MTPVESELAYTLLFALLSFFLIRGAVRRGFFSFVDQRPLWPVPLGWHHVVIAFALYFGAAMFLVRLFLSLLVPLFTKEANGSVLLASSLNALTSFSIFLLLLLFTRTLPHPRSLFVKGTFDARGDLKKALLSWVLSFPLVFLTSQLCDLFLYFVFHIEKVPEQLAVQFVQLAFAHPLSFLLATTTIVLLAPLIEEALFRAFLQSFLRKHLGSFQAIGLSSLCFAFFHYSPEQGLANGPIIASLFILALFLGFLYEERGSLLAPVCLHAFFNGVSVLNLYFLGDFPKTPF